MLCLSIDYRGDKVPKGPSRKQTRDEATLERRQRIVEAALECFLVKGFHQTSIRDIAHKAGISLGNLYNHFDGKDALIAEIATLEVAELETYENILSKTIDPTKAVHKFADALLASASQRENAVLAAEITTEGMRNRLIGDGFVANGERLAQALADVLSRGKKLGTFDARLNAVETAKLIIDLIEGLAMRSAFSGQKPTRASQTALRTIIDRCLHA